MHGTCCSSMAPREAAKAVFAAACAKVDRFAVGRGSAAALSERTSSEVACSDRTLSEVACFANA